MDAKATTAASLGERPEGPIPVNLDLSSIWN
jgi:hypothetical protein